MSAKDYELLLRVRADLQQALSGLDGMRKKLDATGDEAERTGKRAASALDGIGKKFEALKGLAAGLAIGAGIKAVLDAVNESEAAVAQLDARLKSTGGAAGLTRQELIDLSGSMQQLTTYGDEAVLQMENLLLTFTSIKGPVFKEATAVILDVSTALGQDLQSSAIQVGKALNDPINGITALQRVGVKFTDAQKEVIKRLVETGDLAGAQKVILAELTREFGGAAQAAAGTFGGALQQLKHAAGDLLEGDGGNLPEAASSVRELTKTLQDPGIKQGFNLMVSGILSVASAAATGLAKLAEFTKFIGEEIARRQGYFSADDTKGIEAALERITEKQNNLFKSYSSWMSIGSRAGIREQLAALDAERDRLEKLLALGKSLKAIKPAEAPSPIGSASNPQVLPDITVTAPAKQSAEAISKFVDAGTALQQKLIDLQAALDPTAKAWADYNKAIEDANKQAALAKQAPGANPESIDAQRNAIVQLAATQRNAALAKLSEDDRKAYQTLLDTIGTPAEAALQRPIEQLAQLNEMLAQGKISAEQFAEAKAKLGDGIQTKSLPTYGGVDAVVGGPLGELGKAAQASQALEDAYRQQQDVLVEARERKLITEEQYNEREEALAAEHAARLADIDRARAQSSLSAAEQGFSALANATRIAYGEQSRQYRIAFALQKAAAIAQAVLAIQTSIANSSKIGFPWNIVAIAAAVAQGASTLATIRSTQAGFSGGGYTGSGGVNEPAGVVHRGEVVWSQQDVARVGGVSVAEAIRLGNMPGYAGGGFVRAYTDTSSFAASRNVDALAMPLTSSPTGMGSNSQPSEVKVILALDKEQLADELLKTRAGERTVVQHVGNNPRQIQSKWGR